MAPDSSRDGWDQYSRVVLLSLDTLKAELKDTREKLEDFRNQDMAKVILELALLKQKVAIWSAVIGAVAGAAVSALFSSGFSKLLH